MIPAGRVVGIDLGSRRIGLAVSDSAQTVATPVRAVTRSGDTESDWRQIASVIEEYGAVGVVVGVPLSLSGSPGPAAATALDEARKLREALGVEVETIDERFTTTVAASGLRASGRKARRQRDVIDAAAAAELLQTWLARRQAAVVDK